MEKATKAQIRKVRELMRDKKARAEAGLFVAEGEKIIFDIFSKGEKPEHVMVSTSFLDSASSKALLETIDASATPVSILSAGDFDSLSSLKSTQGILALLKTKKTSKRELLSKDKALSILCDTVQDPGNLGAIFRTAAAFGITSVLLFGETADPYNPKVVRASSGTILDVPFCQVDMSDLEGFKDNGYVFFSSQTEEGKGVPIEGIGTLPEKAVIVFGSEGVGVSDELMAASDKAFHIPISDKVESLNVTVAAAISMYAFSRAKK